MDIMDKLSMDFGVADPEPLNPTEKLYQHWTNKFGERYQKIFNCQYWLKHELHVYIHLRGKNLLVCKNTKDGRLELDRVALARNLLEYYFCMVALPSFKTEGSRPEMVDKLADMSQFLDLVMEHPLIKKTIEDPSALI